MFRKWNLRRWTVALLSRISSGYVLAIIGSKIVAQLATVELKILSFVVKITAKHVPSMVTAGPTSDSNTSISK